MKELRKKIINKKLIEKLLMFFLIIQPILDLYFLFDEDVVNFFGFSPSTIIRIVFVFIIGVLFLIVWRNKKELYLYIIYLVLLLIYVVSHHLNALNFTNFYDGYDFGYTLVGELFYILRMLLPLIVIIISSHYEFENEKLDKLMTFLVTLISGSIVLSNLFVVSTGSYSKKIIKGSIFCWFQADRCNLNYMDLASKGFFLDPNRISALLAVLLPVMVYVFIKNPNLKNKIMFFIMFISMYMIGTKVSTYGFIIVTVISFIAYLFFTFIKKELKFNHKITIYFIFIIAASLLILPASPAVNRTFVDVSVSEAYENDYDNKKTENEKKLVELKKDAKEKYNDYDNFDDLLKSLNNEEKKDLLVDFVGTNFYSYNINEHFIVDSYPYKYDPEFWYNVFNLPMQERMSFRKLELLMLQRVKSINNNPMDDYLGITFVREGNIFDLERDFISHYYTLGIFGLLLLLIPYFIIIIVCGIKMLINFKKSFTLKNTLLLMGISLTLISSLFTGNVMDGLIVTLILGFFIGQLINGTFNIGNAIKIETKKKK